MSDRTRSRTTAIAAVPPYLPYRPRASVDLSDNTSLWGPPPSVRATLASLDDAKLSRYPTPYADELRDAIARHHGIEIDRVTTGCGSDDVLDSAMRACCDAGSTIGVAVPTFSVVPSFAVVNELDVVPVPMRRDGTVGATELLATRAHLFYLCSPNNPTGTCIEDTELRALLGATSSVVLLDEAYVDFSDHDALALCDEFPNLVLVRTFSKAFGLAGLRIGYAIGDPEVIGAISVSRGPYKVSALGEAVAVEVLRSDLGWVAERVAEVRGLRAWFSASLAASGLEVLPSSANFVAVVVPEAIRVQERLLARSVLARAYPSLPVFGDLVRVTIGPRLLIEEALELLKEEVR